MKRIDAKWMISKADIQSLDPHPNQPFLFNAIATQAIYAIDLVKERDALEETVDFFREQLEAIANQDYRGNRSTESTIAFDALQADRQRKAKRGKEPD